MAKKRTELNYIEPIGARILVRKDEPKRETKGGIALPDSAEIPTITGWIVTISREVEHDEDVPLRQYDKILFHPKNAIPVAWIEVGTAAPAVFVDAGISRRPRGTVIYG